MPIRDPRLSSTEFRSRAFQAAAISAVVLMVLLCVWYASDVLLVIFAGILFAIFLRGLSGMVSRVTHLREGWSLGMVAAAFLALGGLAFWLLAPEVSRQVDQLSRSLPESLGTFQRQLADTAYGQWLVPRFSEADEWISRRRALSQATSLLSTTVGAFAGFLIMIALGLYLAAEPTFYREGAIRLVPPARRERTAQVLLAIGETLHWWLIGKIIGMVIIGILTWLGLRLLGIPLALTLALIAALLTFIPNVGPIIAVVPAALLALVESPMRALYVLLLYFIVQTVESYLVTPLIQRRTIRLPPAFTLSAQLVLGAMLGALGVALATPLAAAVVVVVQKLYIDDALEKGPAA